MAISYPLAWPTVKAPRQVSLGKTNVAAADESVFTLQRQVQEHQGQRWYAEFLMPPMVRADFAVWEGFVSALKGKRGTFLVGPGDWMPNYGLLGAGGGTPLVNGAGQTGESLAVDGFPNNTLVLKAGDFFGLGSSSAARLFQNLTDATSNGSGQVTLDIWPYLVTAFANDAPLDLATPRGVFALAENDFTSLLDIHRTHGFGFSAIGVP